MTTYKVTNSNNSGVGSLREAIEFANTNAGIDQISIEVNNITLESELEINDSLIIKGNGVVITQTGNEGLFYADDYNDDALIDVSFANLTLTGGNSPYSGGAIFTYENINLDSVNVVDNKAVGFGGGIHAIGATVIVNNSTFKGNEVIADSEGNSKGGAIFTQGKSTLTMDGTVISQNKAKNSAITTENTFLTITNSEIINNNTAGIGTRGALATISNVLVSNNGGSGLVSISGSNITLQSSTISNNIGKFGGGIALEGSNITVIDSKIANNTASETGGGLSIAISSGLKIRNSIVSNNNAPIGSGIETFGSARAEITDTYITGNTGGQQLEGPGFTYKGANLGNPYGVQPTGSIGYTATQTPTEGSGLNLELTEVHRFYQYQKGFHFYTADDNESNVIKSQSQERKLSYSYEGGSFTALASKTDRLTGNAVAGAEEVYRFFNSETGAHLYTMDENEKSYILDNLSNYTLEGTAYYAFETEQESLNTIPVYRMLNSDNGTHLLTTDSNELSYIKDNLANFSLEGNSGVAFYVMETM